MGAALVVLGVSVVIILLLITAVFMLERRQRQRRALRAEAEPSASFEPSIEGFRPARDETPENQNGGEIPDLPPAPQTWWAKWAEQRARRRREVYGPTELGDSLGFGKGPFGF
jgi:Na+-transporting methylmalonyl-CoA/oxaloacetate decarboxylase gamma subunit